MSWQVGGSKGEWSSEFVNDMSWETGNGEMTWWVTQMEVAKITIEHRETGSIDHRNPNHARSLIRLSSYCI